MNLNTTLRQPLSTHSAIKEGDILDAIIEHIHPESGLLVRTKQHHLLGLIKLSNFGSSPVERCSAIEKYKVGQRIVVKASFYLPGSYLWMFNLATPALLHSSSLTLSRAFVPRGMTFAIDGANLVGYVHQRFPMVEPAVILKAVQEGLKQQGYQVFIFLEGRAASWAYHKATVHTKNEFYAFCGSNVSIVQAEADLQLLQLAQYAPETVILSNDHFRDYRAQFPSIVGSPRVRSFELDDTHGLDLYIHGIGEKIHLQDEVDALESEDEGLDEEAFCEVVPVTPRAAEKQVSFAKLRYQIAQHNVRAVTDLSDRYIEMGAFKEACRLDKLALKMQKRQQDMQRRPKRYAK